MRIVEIREKTIALSSPMRNSSIGFESMTGSAIVVVSDFVRHGKPLCGLAFDSVGRYGHGGLLKERFTPRLLGANPKDYGGAFGDAPDPFKVQAILMRDEKPGGHGERAGAIGLIDAAIWDLVGKFEDKPLWRVLAERFGSSDEAGPIPVYASGGHYRGDDDLPALRDELYRYRDQGYRCVKIKCGALDVAQDLRRIEVAIEALGPDVRLAVDCNGTMTKAHALKLMKELESWNIAWIEEPVDPLDYKLHAELAQASGLPIGTGENIFSNSDARNLLRYGGLRSDRDLLQFDISLSYGVPEYLKILGTMAQYGWRPDSCYPHAGHLLALNVVAGLRLGCYEAAPDPARILGGFPSGLSVSGGKVGRPEAPGVGIEAKSNLYAIFHSLLLK